MITVFVYVVRCGGGGAGGPAISRCALVLRWFGAPRYGENIICRVASVYVEVRANRLSTSSRVYQLHIIFFLVVVCVCGWIIAIMANDHRWFLCVLQFNCMLRTSSYHHHHKNHHAAQVAEVYIQKLHFFFEYIRSQKCIIPLCLFVCPSYATVSIANDVYKFVYVLVYAMLLLQLCRLPIYLNVYEDEFLKLFA